PDFDSMTRIDWLGFTLLEPFTVLTDLVITAVCIFGWFKLKERSKTEKVIMLLRWFLLTMGLATMVGGVLGHGLLYLTGMKGKIPGWYISMISVAFFERAVIMHARPVLNKGMGNFFSWLNYAELAAFMVLAAVTLKFIYVELHAVYGLFIMAFSLEIFVYVKTRDKGSVYFFIATFFAAASAVSHAFRFGINEWFNHNDVSHIGMAIAVYFYYLGGKHLTVHSRKG
ncbi:MAG: DUF6962 family protein, partial [Flavobacteriales bacterium]